MKAYGLEGSNLYNSMDVKVMDSSTITIELASYYINVIRGRNKVVAKWIPNRPRSKNNSQLFNALLEWVRTKKISLNGQDENRSAWIAYPLTWGSPGCSCAPRLEARTPFFPRRSRRSRFPEAALPFAPANRPSSPSISPCFL